MDQVSKGSRHQARNVVAVVVFFFETILLPPLGYLMASLCNYILGRTEIPYTIRVKVHPAHPSLVQVDTLMKHWFNVQRRFSRNKYREIDTRE